MMTRIAVLGGGRMGEALIAGLLRGGAHESGDICVAERDDERAQYLHATHGVRLAPPAEAVSGAGCVLLATKPQDVAALLAEFAAHLRTDQLVVSIAAGITTSRLEDLLPAGMPVVRAMPNTPALVGQGMTAVAAGRHAGPAELDTAQALLGAVGRVVRVAEKQLDAVTAVSGSGPAYFFHVVESMIEAGVLAGLPRPLATELVVQTALGSATMLAESGEHPAQLREAVTSPGGTTAAALRVLEDRGLRAAFLAAVEASAARSRELGKSGKPSGKPRITRR